MVLNLQEGKRLGAIEAYTWVLKNLDTMDPVLMKNHLKSMLEHLKSPYDGEYEETPSSNG